MHPGTHLITSSVLGLLVYMRRPARLATLVAAGTLIDFDHLALYGWRTGDWSVIGALRYNRYRGRRHTEGDNRPRYGSLRSWLHIPWLALPAIWAWAGRQPDIRPLALGLTLHLLLDHLEWPWQAQAWLRARGACESCGRRHIRLSVYRLGPPWRSAHYRALCRNCGEQAQRSGRFPNEAMQTAITVVH